MTSMPPLHAQPLRWFPLRYLPLLSGLLCAPLAVADSDLWGAHLDVEAKPGNKRSLGEADMFLPIAQDVRTLFFANIRTRADDLGGREGNFGLGVRRMRDKGWNLGSHVYFDRRRSSDTGFYYNQITLGLEALGPDIEWRSNAYLPVGTRRRDLGSASTAQVSGTAIQVETATSLESSLRGYDAEAGWRLPLFDSDAAQQLRVYLGGYHFSDGDVTVTGPRARIELAFEDLSWFGRGSALFMGAEAQHDAARGSRQFLSVRLRIPLGKENPSRSRLSAQARRMTTAIVRDVDVVTQRHVSRQTETATATADGRSFTVINSATTSGADLASAVAGGKSVVLLSGTFNTSSEVIVAANQTLTGSLTVTTPSGRTATVNTQAAIAAINASGAAVSIGNRGVLSNLSVSNTLDGSVAGIGVRGTIGPATIINNRITVSQNGANDVIGVDASTGGFALVSGNVITVTGSAGAGTLTAIRAFQGGATVSRNTLAVSGGTSNYSIQSSAFTNVFNAGSTGNVLISGVCNGGSLSGNVVFTDGSSCP